MVVRAIKAMAGLGVMMTLVGHLSAQAAAGEPWDQYQIEARIWLDQGTEPVLQRGARVRVYYRTSEDAHVAIFHVDTDGTVRLVFPRSPRENHRVLGGRDYRVLFPETSYWFVDDYPGIGYYFVLASPEPLDLSDFTYSYYDGGWDLSQVGRQVYTDPYEAMDDYVSALIPDWETASYGLDFTSYHVGEAHDYPRFLCYDCHGFSPFNTWNPYRYACSSFRVVVYNDPFYYPVHRYGGAVVVYPATLPARYVFKERAYGETGSPLVTTRAESKELDLATPRRTQPSVALPSRVPTSLGNDRFAPERRGGGLGEGVGARPLVVPWPGSDSRRGSGAAGRVTPTRGANEAGPGDAGSARSGSLSRPVLERRSPARPSNRLDRPTGGAERVPTGRARPAPKRPPNGGSARPAPKRPPNTGAARPAPKRPPNSGSARPSPKRRPNGR